MSRRRETERRAAQPDPVFNSALVSTFINHMMCDGKKSVSANIFYTAMEKVAQRSEEEPLKVFKKAVENCKPVVEVKSRRVGGANYQVPIEVPQARRMSLALRWLIGYARSRSEKGMAERLAAEILDAAAGRGSALKKKEDVHRMADANKAFANYRW
jgi:small subunit ribosomal protein S7